MSEFRNYVEDTMLFESYVGEVESKEDFQELISVLTECEERLDEFLKLGKIGDALKNLSDKGDKKAEEVKKATKETVEKGKDVVKGMAKDAVDAVKRDAKEVAQSHKEIAVATGKKTAELAKEAKDKFVKVSAQGRDALKKIFKNIKDASEDQKKVLAELEPLFVKMEDRKKSVSGSQGLMTLAAILAMGPDGQTPSYKNYTKKLEMLRTTPMLSSFKVSVKKI